VPRFRADVREVASQNKERRSVMGMAVGTDERGETGQVDDLWKLFFEWLQLLAEVFARKGRADIVLEGAGLPGADSGKDRPPGHLPLYQLADLEREAEAQARKSHRRAGLTAVMALVVSALAAVAGFTGLAGTVGTTTAAWIAIAAAIAGAVNVSLQLPTKVEDRAARAAGFESLANEITDAVTVIVSDDQIRENPSALRIQSLKALEQARAKHDRLIRGPRVGVEKS
jgi:hypothetical protein